MEIQQFEKLSTKEFGTLYEKWQWSIVFIILFVVQSITMFIITIKLFYFGQGLVRTKNVTIKWKVDKVKFPKLVLKQMVFYAY